MVAIKIELIEHVEKVQKRATKMIEECKTLKYEERLKYLNIPTLKYRRIRGDLILVFKYFMNLDSLSYFSNFILHDDVRNSCYKIVFVVVVVVVLVVVVVMVV